MRNIVFTFLAMSIFTTLPVIGADITGKQGATMKSLIVYYSYSGKTELAAKTLAAELNADTLKIEDVKRPSTFKAYFSGSFAARKGKSWPIKPINTDLSGYDRVFIGAPIWAGKAAPEINTFIDEANFAGKSAVVFVTMGGSNSDEALKLLSSRIESKGGKITSSFSIKTGGLKNEGIVTKSKEIANQYK